MLETRKVMEIDLGDICNVILKHITIIILFGILGGLIGGLISNFFIEKTYQSSTKIYVMSRQDETMVTYNDVETGRQLTKDYVELITARPVLEEVIEELKLNVSTDTLKNKIQVNVPTDTRVLQIIITDTDPYRAKKICNAVRIASTEHIQKVIDTQKVKVVENANLPEWPIGPNVKLYTIIGAGIAILISLVVIIILFVLNDTIKDARDVEHYLDITVIGTIPQRANFKKGKKL